MILVSVVFLVLTALGTFLCLCAEPPQAPPNFLRASALAEYVKAVVVVPNQEPPEDEEAEPLPDYREVPQTQVRPEIT